MDIRCQRQLKLPMHICANRERSRLEAPHASSLPASMNLTKQPDAGNAAEFAWRRDDVFGRIASRYDLLCDVFSLGIHRLRSEEHTSELQSLMRISYAVFCLKKKKKPQRKRHITLGQQKLQIKYII